MMTECSSFKITFTFSASLLSFVTLTDIAAAEPISLNYDTLSSLEEPLAFRLRNVTFSANGLIDTGLRLGLDSEQPDPRQTANFQLNAETLLPNRWTIRASYFGQYQSDPGSILDVGPATRQKRYQDNIAGFIGGSWLTVFGGNVTGIVRDGTRRKRGTGHAALAFDGTLGDLGDIGAGFRTRLGPAEISGVTDTKGHFDLGATWSRPLGNKDYTFGLRGTRAEFTAQDRSTIFDTIGIVGVAGFIYGSTTLSASAGYEHFSANAINLNRYFASAGIEHKTGSVTLSLEGQVGTLDGNLERAIAFGAKYDIARGLSANFGFNYASLSAAKNGITIVEKDDKEVSLSLRYSY